MGEDGGTVVVVMGRSLVANNAAITSEEYCQSTAIAKRMKARFKFHQSSVHSFGRFGWGGGGAELSSFVVELFGHKASKKEDLKFEFAVILNLHLKFRIILRMMTWQEES